MSGGKANDDLLPARTSVPGPSDTGSAVSRHDTLWAEALRLRASLAPDALQIFRFALNLGALPQGFLEVNGDSRPQAYLCALMKRGEPSLNTGNSFPGLSAFLHCVG